MPAHHVVDAPASPITVPPPPATWPLGARYATEVPPLLPLLTALTASTCPAPLPVDRFPQLLEAAEMAWTRLDVAAFGRAVDAADQALPCVDGVVDAPTVARFDRLVGMQAFLARDTTRARIAFAAARRVDPTSDLSLALVPEGNPLRLEFKAIPIDTITFQTVRVRVDRTPTFDATATDQRPANVPTLFQLQAADGSVRSTAWLWPDEPLPADARPDLRRRNLLLAAAAQGVVAGGLYAGSVLAADTYWDPTTPRDRLDGLRTVVNALNGVALGLVATGTGTAVVALVPTDGR